MDRKHGRSVLWALPLLALVAWACSDVPTEALQQVDATALGKGNGKGHGGGGGGGGSGEIPLIVTLGDAAGDSVRSDGGGAYVHQVDGVVARIMENGNFAIDLDSPTRCLDIHLGPLWQGQPCYGERLSTGDPDVSGGLPALEPGESMTMRSLLYWNSSGDQYFLRFGNNCEGRGFGNPVPENRVIVTHNPDGTWTLSATTGWLCTSDGKGKPGMDADLGEVAAPFTVTLAAP